MDYNVIIERGRSPMNDAIIDFLKTKVEGKKYVDIGTNCAYLLDVCPGGCGCDLSPLMVDLARKKGHDVIVADACNLPYEDKSFQVSVLSCVLEQIEDWEKALSEAIRVAENVYGISPIPNASIWGTVGGTEWVKSVIDPNTLKTKYKAIIEPATYSHYFFCIGSK